MKQWYYFEFVTIFFYFQRDYRFITVFWYQPEVKRKKLQFFFVAGENFFVNEEKVQHYFKGWESLVSRQFFLDSDYCLMFMTMFSCPNMARFAGSNFGNEPKTTPSINKACFHYRIKWQLVIIICTDEKCI